LLIRQLLNLKAFFAPAPSGFLFCIEPARVLVFTAITILAAIA
jgi:hypothetical protein